MEQNDSFLHDILGNPTGGFEKWLADGGLWAILIGLGAVAAWYVVRWAIHSRLRRVTETVEETDYARDVTAIFRGADTLIATVIPAIALGIAAVMGIMHVLGQDVEPAANFFRDSGDELWRWIISGGLRIVLIVLLGVVAWRVARRFVPAVMLRFIRDGRDAADRAEASRKRAETLSAVFVAAINVLIVITVVFTVLTELGVPIGPVLGGVGIAGIAIGFGAQHLVRDVITGLLILMENQYRQGDVVEIAGIAGLVESVNLRRTVLRDLEGKVHTVPHGEITTTTNFTKYWSRVMIDVGVAYKEDINHVFRVLDEIGMELANDPELGLKVIEPIKVLRLNSFDDSAITVRMLGVCKPLTQWELAGWMRKRIKERFDQEGIEIPFPHRTFYWGVDQVKLPFDRQEGPAIAGPPEQPAATPAAVSPDDFADVTQLTPEQREAMLAEMALAAQSAQEAMRREQLETRLPATNAEH